MVLKLIFFHLAHLFILVTSSIVLNCTPQLNGDCTVVSIEAVTFANEEIIIDGQPSTYTDTSIITLGFYNNFTLQFVPTGVLTIFQNLKSLEISNCGTTTLVTDAYTNCNNLLGILLEGGNIPNVPAGFASTCSSVFGLSLANNAIASIDVNAFQGLTSLRTLTLNNNQLTCIPPTLFLNSRVYNSITIGSNLITAIDANIISGLPDLQVFDMSINLLTYLPLLNLTGNTLSESFYGFTGNPINAINSKLTTIFTSRPAIVDSFFFDGISCLPNGTSSFTITTVDYANTSSTLSTCFSNYNPATMSETAPCPVITTTTAATTTVSTTISTTTLKAKTTCVTYPEWKEILKNFSLPQWKGRCPRFHRIKVCLHKCVFLPGGDSDNDRDDRFTLFPHTHTSRQTYKPDHSSTFRPIFPNRPHIIKSGTNRPFLNLVQPGKKPIRG